MNTKGGEKVNVGNLKKILEDVPDEFEIGSKASNSRLKGDNPSDRTWFGNLTKIEIFNKEDFVVLVRGYE